MRLAQEKIYSIHHIITFVKTLIIIVLSMILSISILPAISAKRVATNYFSIEVPDNWAYRSFSSGRNASLLGFGPVNEIDLVPANFSDSLLHVQKNITHMFRETLGKGGSVIAFGQDTDYQLNNAPLGTYVKFRTELLNVTSIQNSTVGNEKAVKVTTTAVGPLPNSGGIFYFFLHNNDAYTIAYTFNKKNNSRYLPEFEKMVKSFNFTSSNVTK